MIVIVDYSVGNIAALLNMFDYLGIEATSSSDPHVIATAGKLVLPGVGSFDKAISALRARQLIEPLNVAVRQRRVPVLGVCLGMQLLARRSEEGTEAGLGWLDADVRLIRPLKPEIKVPHIGWSDIRPTGNSPLFPIASQLARYYFVHSYHVVCDRRSDVAATIDYDGELVCAVGRGNIHGAQFHPEKSHRFGMRLLSSFSELRAAAP